jgi:hypothetical protein
MKSIVSDGMRYIRNGDGAEELYDIASDRWERHDLAERAEWSAALGDTRTRLQQWLDGTISRTGVLAP